MGDGGLGNGEVWEERERIGGVGGGERRERREKKIKIK